MSSLGGYGFPILNIQVCLTCSTHITSFFHVGTEVSTFLKVNRVDNSHT